MSRTDRIEAELQNQPPQLGRLGQLLRLDILLCRQFGREVKLFNDPNPSDFFRLMEWLTNQQQLLSPSLVQEINHYRILLDTKEYSLLEALALYHSLGLFSGNNSRYQSYVEFYIENVRSHYHKLVAERAGDIGLRLPPTLSPRLGSKAKTEEIAF